MRKGPMEQLFGDDRIVDNLKVEGVASSPLKADSALVVNPNAVLAFAVAFRGRADIASSVQPVQAGR